MKEIHRMFLIWLDSAKKDTKEEKAILEDLRKLLSQRFSEDELDSVKNLIFNYATACQKSSFVGGFKKATALWKESMV